MLETKALDVIVSIAKSVERIAKGQEKIINALAEIKGLPKTENDNDPCIYDASYQIEQIKNDRDRDRFCTADGGPFGHC